LPLCAGKINRNAGGITEVRKVKGAWAPKGDTAPASLPSALGDKQGGRWHEVPACWAGGVDRPPHTPQAYPWKLKQRGHSWVVHRTVTRYAHSIELRGSSPRPAIALRGQRGCLRPGNLNEERPCAAS
jgi:hypothetical protein